MRLTPIFFWITLCFMLFGLLVLEEAQAQRYLDYTHFKEISGTATLPSSGYGTIYPKDDNKVYFKNDAGTEYNLLLGGVSGTVLDDLADVSASPAITGDVLVYEGSDWANTQTLSLSGSVTALSFYGDGSNLTGVIPTGTPTEVAFFSGVNLLTSNASFTFDGNDLTVGGTLSLTNGKIVLGELDAYSRNQIWNGNDNSVYRSGASSSNGDSFDALSEGAVFYGTNLGGTQDVANVGYARIKPNRLGLYSQTDGGFDGYYFRVDDDELYLKNDAGSKTFNIDRRTGDITASSSISALSFYGDGSNLTSISHGDLSDLTTTDDHTQYLLLAGRGAGQTITGSLAVTADATISGNLAANYFYGDGSYLTGIVAGGGSGNISGEGTPTQVSFFTGTGTETLTSDEDLTFDGESLTVGGTVTATAFSGDGSGLTGLVSNHDELQNISGGAASDYYHLTSAQHTDLTDSGTTTLHMHDHDVLPGFVANEHIDWTNTTQDFSTTGSASAVSFYGDGSHLTGLSSGGDITGSGTATQVSFFSASKTLTSDEDLTFDGESLTVGGTVTATAFVGDGSGLTGIITTASSAVVFTDTATSALTLPGVGEHLLYFDSYDGALWNYSPAGTRTLVAGEICYLGHITGGTVAGGAAAAGTYNDRPINFINKTRIEDDSSGCTFVTLDSNQFTIVAGTYEIDVIAMAHDVDFHKVLIYNFTTASYASEGLIIKASAAENDQTPSFAKATVKLTSPNTFGIKHYTVTAKTASGMGDASNVTNVYMVITVKKIK